MHHAWLGHNNKFLLSLLSFVCCGQSPGIACIISSLRYAFFFPFPGPGSTEGCHEWCATHNPGRQEKEKDRNLRSPFPRSGFLPTHDWPIASLRAQGQSYEWEKEKGEQWQESAKRHFSFFFLRPSFPEHSCGRNKKKIKEKWIPVHNVGPTRSGSWNDLRSAVHFVFVAPHCELSSFYWLANYMAPHSISENGQGTEIEEP